MSEVKSKDSNVSRQTSLTFCVQRKQTKILNTDSIAVARSDHSIERADSIDLDLTSSLWYKSRKSFILEQKAGRTKSEPEERRSVSEFEIVNLTQGRKYKAHSKTRKQEPLAKFSLESEPCHDCMMQWRAILIVPFRCRF